MNQKQNILVCIPPDIEMDALRRYILNSASFANQVDANIHFFIAPEFQGAMNSILKTSEIGGVLPTKTVLHAVMGEWPSEMLSENVKQYSCNLILIPAGDITEENSYGVQIRRDLLQDRQRQL